MDRTVVIVIVIVDNDHFDTAAAIRLLANSHVGW
jgi:hypothetical protein